MSRREPPGASVIVLNFNGEAILRRCLEALAAQTCGDFEVIVVDNASTDGSEVILKEFEDRDTRFRIVRSPSNRGVAGGRNLGIQAARGEFIAFIDNDGFARPDWLEQCLATFADLRWSSSLARRWFSTEQAVR
jgi:teichuronic acid biosynthesis glycosyltransferase TuaG